MAANILPVIQALGPRIIIPAFFLGPKVSEQIKESKYAEAAKTIAFLIFVVLFITLFFQGEFFLSLIPLIAGTSYYYMKNDPANKIYRY